MAECRKCGKTVLDEWICCPFCSTLINPKKHSRRARANGTGTAYKRGNTWTAKVILGYKESDQSDKLVSVAKTKGGFKTKTEALLYCEQMKKSPRKVEHDVTFKAMYDRWFEFYKDRIKSTTLAGYKAAFKHFSSAYYLKMREITVDDLQECIDECERGRSTKDDMKTVCSLIFKYAEQTGIVEKNLSGFLFVGREQKGKREALTISDLRLIQNAIGKEKYADYVYFLCYTGYRPNEFLTLKKTAYHEITRGDKTYHYLIAGIKTEAGKDRVVTISPKVLPILKAQLEKDGEYLFPNVDDGSVMKDEYFRESCFKPLMDKLGIKGKVPYSCRHTFANLLKDVYGPDVDKAKLIGHADASMTKYYQSADYEAMTRITDSL